MTALAVTGSDLHRAATWAARCSPAKPDFPVLGGLLLEAGDELSLTGWDLDVRATAEVAATTTEPGRLLVSAPLLVAVAGEVGRDDTVLVEGGHGDGVRVCCGRSEWVLPALPLQDWPQLPPTPPVVGTVAGDALRAALAGVLPAVSRDRSLQMLTGVRMEGAPGGLTLCATDRWRLATDVVSWLDAPAADDEPRVLVPGAVLDLLARAAGSGPVSLLCDGGSVGLATAGHLVTGRLMAAEFPRWRFLVPARDPDRCAVVDVAELSAAVTRAALVATDPWHLLLAFHGDEVTVTVPGRGRGRARAVAGCDLRGDDIDIVFRGPYLAAALAGCGPTAELHFGSSPTRPVLVCPAGDDPYRHVLCPVGVPAGPA